MLNTGPGGVVVVVPTTTARRDLPVHVEIEPGESGLHEISYAKCEDVKSVPVERLMQRFGAASSGAVHQISQTLRLILEL
jgi:mRNA interferase MazF